MAKFKNSEEVEDRTEIVETDSFLSPKNRCKQLWRSYTNSNFDLDIQIALWTTDLLFTKPQF